MRDSANRWQASLEVYRSLPSFRDSSLIPWMPYKHQRATVLIWTRFPFAFRGNRRAASPKVMSVSAVKSINNDRLPVAGPHSETSPIDRLPRVAFPPTGCFCFAPAVATVVARSRIAIISLGAIVRPKCEWGRGPKIVAVVRAILCYHWLTSLKMLECRQPLLPKWPHHRDHHHRRPAGSPRPAEWPCASPGNGNRFSSGFSPFPLPLPPENN